MRRSVKQYSYYKMLAQIIITMVTVATGTSARCLCYHPCCGNLCRKVLISLMFLLTVCCAINPNNTTETKDICSTISPRSAYFLEGEDIVLTCSTDNIPAENLTFMRGKKSSQVPEEYIHKLNDTAIKLIIPNVTGEDIDSSKDSKPYKCGNKHTKECYDVVHVRLEYYPRKPKNLDCRVYDFEEMTCTWDLGVNYHGLKDINVTCEAAWFTYKSDNPAASWVPCPDKNQTQTACCWTLEKYQAVDNPAASWAPCPDQNQTACHWSPDYYQAPLMMYAKVSVTAIERNITKETFKNFTQYDIMEPGPVKELKVRRTAGERCMELDWQPTHLYHSFRFNMTYSSACTPEPKLKRIDYRAFKNEKFIGSRILCGLTPYTEYTYTVTGILIEEKERDNRTFLERGYWSRFAVLTERTDSDVVDINPSTSAGLYEIITRPGEDSLRLYWKPLTECDLHDAAEHVSYIVTVYNENKQVKHPDFVADIDIPKFKILNVTLQADNSIGPAPNPRVVTIFPTKFAPNPSELIIQDNKTDDGCVRLPEIVVSENQSTFSAIFHTLVWCKGTQLGCQEPIKWNKTNDPSFDCDDDYRYGLVTHGYHKGLGQIADSGIHWEHCRYQLGKKADKPLKNVYLPDVQPSSGFSVEWSRYSCDEMTAFITNYMVTYCVGHGTDDCTCSEDAVSVNVSRKRSSYTSGDLSPGSQVCIWVRGISKAGSGPANTKPLFHTIFANSDGQSILIVVIIVAAVILAVLLVTFVSIRGYRKYQRMQHEEGGIYIPPVDEPLVPIQPDEQNNESTLPYYVSPDTMKDNDGRTYSLGDITEVLDGNYNQPEDIDSYLLAGQNSDQNSKDESDDVENTSLKTPLLISENQKPSDKSVNADKTSLKRFGNEPLTMIGGAVYIDRADKVKNEPGHCRDSISSLLSDAHNEQNFSIEDLRCDQNSLDHSLMVPDQGLHLEEMLSTFDNLCENPGDKIGVDKTAALRKGNDSVERENRRTSEIVHNSDERETQGKGTPNSAMVSVGKIDDIVEPFDIGSCDHIGDKENSKIDDHSNTKNGSDVQWNSSAGVDFNEQLCKLGHHYKQATGLDSDDAVFDKTNSGLSSDGCEINKHNSVKNASTGEQGMNNHEKNQTNSDLDRSKNELDSSDMDGNVESVLDNITDKTVQGRVTNEGTLEENSLEDMIEDVEQNRNKTVKGSLLNNSEELISEDSGNSSNRHRTSGSLNSSIELQPLNSLNSGPLQSYVTAENESFKEQNHVSDRMDLKSNNKDGDKRKTCNINGKINGTEHINKAMY